MIVVDTSILVAIVTMEIDADRFVDILRVRQDVRIPASCYVEAVMVLSKLPNGRADLDSLLDRFGIAIIGSDARQARLAADAFARFGRGSGHAAKLNFGDCLSYAAAAAHEAPLMFKGDDFPHTDLRPAL